MTISTTLHSATPDCILPVQLLTMLRRVLSCRMQGAPAATQACRCSARLTTARPSPASHLAWFLSVSTHLPTEFDYENSICHHRGLFGPGPCHLRAGKQPSEAGSG